MTTTSAQLTSSLPRPNYAHGQVAAGPLPQHAANAAAVGAPSLVEGPDLYNGAVTAESLYVYLQTRLTSVDTQINEIFTRQQNTERVRSCLREIQSLLGPLNDENTGDAATPELVGIKEKALEQIASIRSIDPKLADTLEARLQEQGQIFYGRDNYYSGDELKASRQVLDGIGGDLEATAQLDMIKLQSLMSARQTAVGLATNLTAACDRSLESIVANIGK